MARILIFGGHGKVALLLEPLLVERGHTVTAVIRNPEHEAEVAATGAQPVVADVETLDLDQLTNLAEAKWRADEHLAASDLDWTILGPGTLTLDPPTGRIRLDPEGRGDVPRADVAAVIAAAIDDDSTIGRTIRFGGGDEVIGHATAG